MARWIFLSFSNLIYGITEQVVLSLFVSCASLPNISICVGVVRAVAFQQSDAALDTKTATKGPQPKPANKTAENLEKDFQIDVPMVWGSIFNFLITVHFYKLWLFIYDSIVPHLVLP